MNGRSQWPSQTTVIRDAADNQPLSAERAPREDRANDFPFFYENCGIGFFPADPVDFYAFAKGQLMAMAIFVPVAIAVFFLAS